MIRTALFLSLALGATACAPVDTKPESDPDTGLIDDGKTDSTSNYYTDIQGALFPGRTIEADIGYPDWYHGYTVVMSEGARIKLRVSASDPGPVRLYGPATSWSNGKPRFGTAARSRYAQRTSSGDYVADIEWTSYRPGTYMLVYGPSYVWEADYTVTSTCTGCLRPDECLSDAGCDAGETCQPNGAACITYPCDVAYDVCQPAESCSDSNPCEDGFCGWDADQNRVCKPWRNEGESCGGFTLPEFRYDCRPDLQCVCTEPTCDAPGICE